MHIWTGIDVDDQLRGLSLRRREIEREVGIISSVVTLPLHVSMKMSFPMADERAEAVIDSIDAFCRTLPPLEADVRDIENAGEIVWIRLIRNAALDDAHARLVDLLQTRFGVAPHPYDLDFLFHTTLFMDGDAEKISRAYEAVRGASLPPRLRLDSFVIGTSPEGVTGTYRIVRTLSKNNGAT